MADGGTGRHFLAALLYLFFLTFPPCRSRAPTSWREAQHGGKVAVWLLGQAGNSKEEGAQTRCAAPFRNRQPRASSRTKIAADFT